jgi:DNA-binding MarR family transcriptional regulator
MQMHLLSTQHSDGYAEPRMDEVALGAWRAFLNAHALVTRRIGEELAAADLPDLSWYDLLWTLYRHPDKRMKVNALAREVVLSPTAMSRFVDRVERAGCVRREAVPGDRRSLHIVLTGEGEELLRRMWPVYERGIERHFAEHLGRHGATVRRTLDDVAAAARES